MSVELMDLIAQMFGQQDGVTTRVDWGEPDAEGFYTPSITVVYSPRELP